MAQIIFKAESISSGFHSFWVADVYREVLDRVNAWLYIFNLTFLGSPLVHMLQLIAVIGTVGSSYHLRLTVWNC